MTYAVDLSNLALEANAAVAGITANATAISAISVGNSTVNSSINATALTVGSNVATFGTAVYHVANGNVGIGTSSPGAKLAVSKNAVTPPAPSLTGTALQLSGEDAVNNRIWMDSFAASDNITFRRASGTAASPTATLNGDIFGFLSCVGYGTTGYSSGSSGQMRFNATQDFTDTARGTSIDFYTTPNGSTTSANRMIIDQSGNVGIANTTPSNTLSVTGTASISGALTTGSNVATFGTAVYHVANGNVGIGTSTPPSCFTVAGGSVEIRDGNYFILRPAANGWDMRLQATGTQLDVLSGGSLSSPIMSLVNGGNVGIGNSTPSNTLSVTGTASISGALTIGSNTATFGTALYSVANGNVGIGTSSPANRLKVYKGTSADSTGQPAGDFAAIVYHATNANTANGLLIKNNWLAAVSTVLEVGQDTVGGAYLSRFIVNGAGYVGIGTASPAYQLQLSTDSAAKPSTSTWTIASDARIKTETAEYTKGLDAVCGLRPVTYEYNGKAGFEADGKENISIIAQEAIVQFPECIGTFKAKLNPDDEEDTELFNWNGHALTFALVNSIKELKAQNDALVARITALESK